MKLRALSNINSGQFNAGDVFDISDNEAEQLIEAGAAEAVDGSVGEAEETVSPEAPVAPDPLDETPEEISIDHTETTQPTAEQIAEDLAQLEESSSADGPTSEEVRAS